MKLVPLASLVLLASLVFPAGCASSGPQGQSRASHNSVRNQSGLMRHSYELSRRAQQFSLSLACHASEGFFVYTLVDPHGTTAWEGRVKAGQNFKQSHPLQPVPGKWTLTLTMESTTGSYDLEWKNE
jgi:hypothetical protein